MKLYLKSDFNKQRLIGYQYGGGRKFKGYMLYPDKCPEDIPDKHAKIILKQNGHIVSTEPFKTKKSQPKDPVVELVSEPEYDPLTEDDVDMVLQEMASKALNVMNEGAKGMKAREIREIGKTLGVSISPTIKREKQIEAVKKRCEEVLIR